MDIEQLEMDLGIPENEIEDVALDLDYNPEEADEDQLDFIDEMSTFLEDFPDDLD